MKTIYIQLAQDAGSLNSMTTPRNLIKITAPVGAIVGAIVQRQEDNLVLIDNGGSVIGTFRGNVVLGWWIEDGTNG